MKTLITALAILFAASVSYGASTSKGYGEKTSCSNLDQHKQNAKSSPQRQAQRAHDTANKFLDVRGSK